MGLVQTPQPSQEGSGRADKPLPTGHHPAGRMGRKRPHPDPGQDPPAPTATTSPGSWEVTPGYRALPVHLGEEGGQEEGPGNKAGCLQDEKSS